MAYDYNESVTLSNGIKQEYIKIVKCTFADFKTGGQTSTKEILPSDASIIRIDYWKKTAFSGGGVTAVSLNIVQANTGVSFVSALDVHTPAAGAVGSAPLANAYQAREAGQLPDIPLNFVGTATTGNPTAGEIYFVIRYVR
jgi:hypothetical protein